jgi:hypothetical protein
MSPTGFANMVATVKPLCRGALFFVWKNSTAVPQSAQEKAVWQREGQGLQERMHQGASPLIIPNT